ncbi:MAG: hypothetical protein KY476_26850, partial [Planctomycetes bacterium]|nr:hypothetical protein [Planctomycetota bacterium]
TNASRKALDAALARGERPRAGWVPAAGVLAGLLLFVLALPAAVIGWEANLRHLDTWHRKVVAPEDAGGANNFDQESLRNQSLENAASQVVGLVWGIDTDTAGAAIEPALDALKASLLLLLAACGWAAVRRPDPRRDAALYGLAGGLTLLISPLSWGHHYVILLIPAAFVPYYLWCAGARRAAVTTAAAPAVLSLLHYAALPYAGRIGLLGLGTTVWYVAAAVATLRYRPDSPASAPPAGIGDRSTIAKAA